MQPSTSFFGLLERQFDREREQKRQFAAAQGVTVNDNRVTMRGRVIANCPSDWDAITVAYALAQQQAQKGK